MMSGEGRSGTRARGRGFALFAKADRATATSSEGPRSLRAWTTPALKCVSAAHASSSASLLGASLESNSRKAFRVSSISHSDWTQSRPQPPYALSCGSTCSANCGAWQSRVRRSGQGGASLRPRTGDTCGRRKGLAPRALSRSATPRASPRALSGATRSAEGNAVFSKRRLRGGDMLISSKKKIRCGRGRRASFVLCTG